MYSTVIFFAEFFMLIKFFQSKYSLHYCNTTLGENVRYFMHKYNIVFTDWFEYINTLYKKINIYVKNNFDAECYYVRTTVRELCEARDSGCP